ncbi:uncharacterized protein [Pyrus communis]|uniref:uncharacterized protein isoform X2 n=1 Tax=Pyrus communis TaxID=23211 RepID=UPI0035BF0536
MDAGKLAGESTQIVSRILVKALMAMLSPDFSLCLCLIPERVTFIVLDKQLVVGKFSHGEPHGKPLERGRVKISLMGVMKELGRMNSLAVKFNYDRGTLMLPFSFGCTLALLLKRP